MPKLRKRPNTWKQCIALNWLSSSAVLCESFESFQRFVPDVQLVERVEQVNVFLYFAGIEANVDCGKRARKRGEENQQINTHKLITQVVNHNPLKSTYSFDSNRRHNSCLRIFFGSYATDGLSARCMHSLRMKNGSKLSTLLLKYIFRWTH